MISVPVINSKELQNYIDGVVYEIFNRSEYLQRYKDAPSLLSSDIEKIVNEITINYIQKHFKKITKLG